MSHMGCSTVCKFSCCGHFNLHVHVARHPDRMTLNDVSHLLYNNTCDNYHLIQCLLMSVIFIHTYMHVRTYIHVHVYSFCFSTVTFTWYFIFICSVCEPGNKSPALGEQPHPSLCPTLLPGPGDLGTRTRVPHGGEVRG